MPKRIPFHVVYATSEDPSYPACELNRQGPSARGWRSAGPPPHELLLRLVHVASLHKLQLLAHHQLVPSSVEVLVSGGLVTEGAATPCGATYTSVGRVALAQPVPQARTRELRSAALPEPTIARFVKLRLYPPHPPASENDQVALMAVNVLGEELEDAVDQASPVSSSKDLCYSPYDDLAFVMYVDTDIADLIRSLDEKKKVAVVEERFEYARRLKSASSALAAAGIRIGRWRLRKRTAAARDDFELARRMRDRIADALVAIKEDSMLCKLFEEEGPDPRNDASMRAEYDFAHHLSPSVAAGCLSLDIPSPLPPHEPDEQQRFQEQQEEQPQSPVQEYYNDVQKSEPSHQEDSRRKFSAADLEEELERQRQEEYNKLEEARKREEERILEEARRIERAERQEQKRLEELKKREEEERILEEARKIEEQRILEEARKIEEARKEEERNVEERNVEELLQRKEEEVLRRETDSPRRSITPNAANGTLIRRRNKSAGPRSTFEAYEERLLPALRHSHTNEFLREAREEEASGGSASSHQRPPHKLNERERKQAALPIIIFGYPLVEKFYSKNYLDKEEGLARLRAELTTPSNGSTKTSPNKTARAAALMLQRALRDKVFSVYSQANEGVRVLFQQFVPDRVCAAEVQRCLEKLLPELLRACGDPAPRVHSTAQHTVLTIADVPAVKSIHYIPQQLVRPVAAAMHPRLALSRLQMLEQLLLSHGISTDKNSGLTVRRLAECGAAGAQHAAGSVRAAAERILLAAYARSPRVVRAQLPPDDAVTRRNLIYRHLFQQFDRIDMQKMLNQAPSEEHLLNGDQSEADAKLETASVSQSTRSGMTSSLMTSSLGVTSSYSLKSMTSSASGVTLAPSSLGSLSTTTSKTKSSLKKSPTKRYTASRAIKDFSCPGYNKLRLDSAVSPKHSPRTSAAVEKRCDSFDDQEIASFEPCQSGHRVHFQDSKIDEVVYRRSKRNTEHRHSMIHYDHDSVKLQLKERPVTVYEPLHLDYRDSPSLSSPKASKNYLRSMDSLPMDSPRNDLRCDSDRSLDSPKVKDYYREVALESPKLVAGLRNVHLDDTTNSQMDESGYYSPGCRQQMSTSEHQLYESYEGAAAEASCDSTPEPVCSTSCTWCGRRVRADALESHYWRRCVVLARCPHCRAALEARALHQHLLEECSMSEGSWKACLTCGAALRVDDTEYHVNCYPLGMDEWKCPYCLTNVLARDLPWQRHLMQCPRNPRLSQSS